MTPRHLNPGLPLQLSLAGLTLEGFSVSGLATYVTVKEWRCSFDLGYCPTEVEAFDTVFLSHSHSDHAGDLNRYVGLRSMRGLSAPTIYLPEEAEDSVERFLAAHRAMNAERPDHRPYRLVPVKAGDRFAFRSGHEIEVVPAHHRLPSVGYTAHSVRSKLLPAYAGLDGTEVAAAKKRGETVTETVRVPRLTFLGDHTDETLRKNPEVGRSDVLVAECTFGDSVSPDHAREYGHMHLEHLLDLAAEGAPALNAPNLVLKHFSMRDTPATVRSYRDRLPENLRNRTRFLFPEE